VPETGYPRSPKLQKGALVQLVETLNVPLPNIVPFQFNPMTMSRTMKPWNPLDVSEANRGLPSPAAQPFDPEDTITLELELDASDQLEDDETIAKTFGVADRIAALEKMLFASSSPLGQVLELASSLLGGGQAAPQRPSVPVTFFIWGVGRIVPVRITSYSIEEQLFLPSLRPVQAKVSVELRVLTPEVFKCAEGPAVELAKAAYKLFRGQQDALAVLHVANTADELRALLPFP
jgi:hypothetical protein